MKATFFERLGSYIIDALIVSVIFSIICIGLESSTSNAGKIMEELDNQLVSGAITIETYIEEYKDVLYDYQKENVLQTSISVALTIAYYVIFQYMNKGATIGKTLLKLRVVDNKTNKPLSIQKGILRTFLIYSILSGIISIIFLYITSKSIYFISYGSFLIIESIFVLITILFVLYKKDGRGLHDIMSNSKVIKESR